MWFIATHAEPQGADSLRFDRSRFRLLVRCDPLSFKSISQDLALGTAPPVSRTRWKLTGPDSVTWRVPAAGATDSVFLSESCRFVASRRVAA